MIISFHWLTRCSSAEVFAGRVAAGCFMSRVGSENCLKVYKLKELKSTFGWKKEGMTLGFDWFPISSPCQKMPDRIAGISHRGLQLLLRGVGGPRGCMASIKRDWTNHTMKHGPKSKAQEKCVLSCFIIMFRILSSLYYITIAHKKAVYQKRSIPFLDTTWDLTPRLSLKDQMWGTSECSPLETLQQPWFRPGISTYYHDWRGTSYGGCEIRIMW